MKDLYISNKANAWLPYEKKNNTTQTLSNATCFYLTTTYLNSVL